MDSSAKSLNISFSSGTGSSLNSIGGLKKAGSCQVEQKEDYMTKAGINYVVVRTKFHGGGIVSKHKTIEGAVRAAKKYRGSSCTCGCCNIVPTSIFARKALQEVFSDGMGYVAGFYIGEFCYDCPLYDELPTFEEAISPYDICR